MKIPFPFIPIPRDSVKEMFENVGLSFSQNVGYCVAIGHYLNRKRRVKIGNDEYPSGWSIPVADETIASVMGLARSTVCDKLNLLEEKKILEVKDGCYRFKYWTEWLKIARNPELKPTTENDEIIYEETDSNPNTNSDTNSDSNSDTNSDTNSDMVSESRQKKSESRQKKSESRHVVEALDDSSRYPPNPPTHHNHDHTSGNEGGVKELIQESLTSFCEVFAPNEKLDGKKKKRWVDAVRDLISYITGDTRIVKVFDESDRLVQAKWVIHKVFKFFETDGFPPQWPGYILERRKDVVDDFIAQAVGKNKPYKPPPEIVEQTPEQKQANIENMGKLREALGITDEPEPKLEPVKQPKQHESVSVAARLASELGAVAGELIPMGEAHSYERILHTKTLLPDVEWDQYTDGVILRAVDIALAGTKNSSTDDTD